MDILDCYGAEIDALGDLAGDFDYLSTVEREAWIAHQWTELAEAMGWSEELAEAFDRIRYSRLGMAQSTAIALAAFRSVAQRDQESQANADRARVREQALMTLAGRSGHVWRVEVDAASLPSGVCSGASAPKRPLRVGRPVSAPSKPVDPSARSTSAASTSGGREQLKPQRVFLADVGPSYFWDPAPRVLHYRPGCGQQAPLRLSLGTFPWVYGHRLQAPAPGALWRSFGERLPAALGLEIAASLWHPRGNLRQDGREVVSHWRHWRSTTSELVAAIPESSDDPLSSGCLARSGHVLETCKGQGQLVGLNGPRGFICADAYNFIHRRFAAFFAMRRALLRAQKKLSRELRALVDANPDPCLRQHLNLTLAAKAGA